MARDADSMAGLESTQGATRKWRMLFATCFKRRIRADRTTEALRQLWDSEPIPRVHIVSIILTSGADSAIGVDPLIAAYLEQVLRVTSVDICDVLMALLSQSQYALKKPNSLSTTENQPTDNSVLQESVFALLIRLFTSAEPSKPAHVSRRITRALAEWLTACNYHETVLQVQSEGLRAPEASVLAAFETLGTLTITVFSNGYMREDLPRAWSKGG